MKSFGAKMMGAIAAFAVLLTLTGCGSINIIGLAIPAMVELTEGDTEALAVSFSADKENATDEAILEAAGKLTLEWKSSDEAIATVDEHGNVTAVKGGEATITVKAGEILSACKITVKVPLRALDTEPEMALYINGANAEDGFVDSKTLDVKPNPANADDVKLTFRSADESIATVDQNGKITAVSDGCTTITVSSGNVSAAIEVTVCTVPATIEVEDAELYVGRSGELNVHVDDDGVTYTAPLSYASSDETVVTVDGDGIVAGVSEGEATITVSNGTGVVGTATITVRPVPVVRPASNSGNSAGNSTSNGGSGSTGAAGTAGGGSAAPAPTPAAPSGEIDSTNWYLYYDCQLCKGKGHDRFSCPNVAHYHGNGYDEGVCPGCDTIYTAYLAGAEATLPEGNAWE